MLSGAWFCGEQCDLVIVDNMGKKRQEGHEQQDQANWKGLTIDDEPQSARLYAIGGGRGRNDGPFHDNCRRYFAPPMIPAKGFGSST